ncbi:hypothetical protein GJQ54_04650 [Oceanospirillaceae bacterium ASx5O]|nr:hypothetical protein GJQ54_04650 [Oceanospirillaceae bacterium ASx5O]
MMQDSQKSVSSTPPKGSASSSAVKANRYGEKMPGELNEMIGKVKQALTATSDAVIRVSRAQAEIGRVDGLIIGTGEADFTKDNVFYSLTYKDKPFSLIDVPGIEGDEAKYQPMVERAVAKAHLVFYVNGTNKKPEKTTAEKIKRYLRRGAKVCPIVNVRGSADAYEFKEDRETLLTTHNQSALAQTVDVLSETLGENALIDSYCVQGLLGFSGLAYAEESQLTTIHPSRAKDLCVQQKNYLKFFGSPADMYAFSNLEALKQVVNEKQLTLKEDIVESNKSKVKDLLNENIKVIEFTLSEYKDFIEKLNPEIEKCKSNIEGAMSTATRLYSASKKNSINKLFDEMVDRVDKIVSDHFGNNEIVKQKVEMAFKEEQAQVGLDVEKKCKNIIEELHEKIEDALSRLQQDVGFVYLESLVEFEGKMNLTIGDAKDFGGDLGAGGVGGILLTIGSMAFTGFKLGAPGSIPTAGIPITAIIGGVIGAVLGAFSALVGVLMGKDSRIRKVKGKINEMLSEARGKHLNGISEDVASFTDHIKGNISEPILKKVDELAQQLSVPLQTLDQEIKRLKLMKNKIEDMGYGAI